MSFRLMNVHGHVTTTPGPTDVQSVAAGTVSGQESLGSDWWALERVQTGVCAGAGLAVLTHASRQTA